MLHIIMETILLFWIAVFAISCASAVSAYQGRPHFPVALHYSAMIHPPVQPHIWHKYPVNGHPLKPPMFHKQSFIPMMKPIFKVFHKPKPHFMAKPFFRKMKPVFKSGKYIKPMKMPMKPMYKPKHAFRLPAPTFRRNMLNGFRPRPSYRRMNFPWVTPFRRSQPQYPLPARRDYSAQPVQRQRVRPWVQYDDDDDDNDDDKSDDDDGYLDDNYDHGYDDGAYDFDDDKYDDDDDDKYDDDDDKYYDDDDDKYYADDDDKWEETKHDDNEIENQLQIYKRSYYDKDNDDRLDMAMVNNGRGRFQNVGIRSVQINKQSKESDDDDDENGDERRSNRQLRQINRTRVQQVSRIGNRAVSRSNMNTRGNIANIQSGQRMSFARAHNYLNNLAEQRRQDNMQSGNGMQIARVQNSPINIAGRRRQINSASMPSRRRVTSGQVQNNISDQRNMQKKYDKFSGSLSRTRHINAI